MLAGFREKAKAKTKNKQKNPSIFLLKMQINYGKPSFCGSVWHQTQELTLLQGMQTLISNIGIWRSFPPCNNFHRKRKISKFLHSKAVYLFRLCCGPKGPDWEHWPLSISSGAEQFQRSVRAGEMARQLSSGCIQRGLDSSYCKVAIADDRLSMVQLQGTGAAFL